MMGHTVIKTTLYLSRFPESCFCFDFVLYSLSYVGSRDLVHQWPAVHNQNKQRFLDETFKTRWSTSERTFLEGLYANFTGRIGTMDQGSLICIREDVKASVYIENKTSYE